LIALYHNLLLQSHNTKHAQYQATNCVSFMKKMSIVYHMFVLFIKWQTIFNTYSNTYWFI